MSEKIATCGLNYEAEYNRLREELAKCHEEKRYWEECCQNKERELAELRAIKKTIEVIFGRKFDKNGH